MSVVLTTFNRSTLLLRAVDSVLDQTLGDLELIVVDDCSTDDTARVVNGIDDPRVSYVRHERNLGLAEARNSGIRRARGRFICFLDDDDAWMADKLRVQVSAFEAEQEPDTTLVYCQAIVDDGISSDVRPVRSLRPGEPLCEYLMCGEGAIPIHAVIATRELVAGEMFAAGQRRLEDYTWFLRLERRGVSFVLVEQPLVVWNVQLRRTRLSHDVNFEYANEWLDSCGTSITSKARRAFIAREIAPLVDHSRNRLRILQAILIAMGSRSISVPEGLKSLFKAFLPVSARYWLRHVLPRSRFG